MGGAGSPDASTFRFQTLDQTGGSVSVLQQQTLRIARLRVGEVDDAVVFTDGHVAEDDDVVRRVVGIRPLPQIFHQRRFTPFAFG